MNGTNGISAASSASWARRLFFVLLGAAFLYILYPLLFAVLMGGVLAVLFTPLVARLEARRLSPAFASLVVTVGITLIVLIPTTVMVYQGSKMGVQELERWKVAPQREIGDWTNALLDIPAIHNLLVKCTEWFPIGMQDLTETLQDTVRSVGGRAAEILAGLLASLPGMAFNLIIIVVSVYFFLEDGQRFGAWVRRRSIFSPKETERLLLVLIGVCRSVVLASVISGIAQATFFGFWVLVTGLPNVLLATFLIFFASFVPVIGAGPVTFGLAIQQFIIGHTVAGCILAVAAVLTSMLDNFVRPWFLRGSVNLHPLLAFIAAFGGLQTLGFAGVFLGPIVASLFLALVEGIGASETT